MSNIELTRDEKTKIAERLQRYCENDLDIELGQFDAEFIVDHIAQSLGITVYNQALSDAQKVIEAKIMDINDELYQLEKYEE